MFICWHIHSKSTSHIVLQWGNQKGKFKKSPRQFGSKIVTCTKTRSDKQIKIIHFLVSKFTQYISHLNFTTSKPIVIFIACMARFIGPLRAHHFVASYLISIYVTLEESAQMQVLLWSHRPLYHVLDRPISLFISKYINNLSSICWPTLHR